MIQFWFCFILQWSKQQIWNKLLARHWKLNCSFYWALVKCLCFSWWQTSMKYIDSCLLGCHQAPFISLFRILVLPPRQELPFDFPWNLCFPENISPLQPGMSYIVRDWLTGLYKAWHLKPVTKCRAPKLFLSPLRWGLCSIRWDWSRGFAKQQ